MRDAKPVIGAAREPSAWRSVVLTLGIGLGLTVLAFLLLRDRESTLRRAILEERATGLTARLDDAFSLPVETARSVSSLFAASEVVEADEFRRFVRPALDRFRHVYAFEWAPRITAAERPAFEAGVSDRRAAERVGDGGSAGYRIREAGPTGGLVVAGSRETYVPLLYNEPANDAAGYDIASHPSDRGLLDRACAEARAVASGRRQLVEDDTGVVAAIAYVPTWRRGAIPPTAGERCRAVLGYVNLVFHVGTVVDGAIAGVAKDDLDMVLSDLSEHGQVIHETSPGAASRVAASPWSTRRTFHFVDRLWALDIAPAHAPVLTMPLVALLLGAITSMLAAALVGGLRRIRALRREVREARSFGQYVLEEEIGRGGMGVVYRARHALMQRPTALKLVSPDADQPHRITQFEREVQITSQLTHPNTIAIYDYGHTREGEFYYVMEYVDGITFEQLIEHDGPQPIARTIHFMRQICGALREAHAMGVIHRDLKPANLMVTQRGGVADFVKVLDFGLVKQMHPGDVAASTIDAADLARLAITGASHLASTVRTIGDRSPRDRHTLEGQFLGTAGYASPEVVVGGTTDARSDIYALGAVWFALLTGRPAFDEVGAAAIFVAQMRDEAPRPSALVPSILGEVDDLVTGCLSRDPGNRPQSVDELLAALNDSRLPSWSLADAEAWWRARSDAVRSATPFRPGPETGRTTLAARARVVPEENRWTPT